MWDSDVQYYTKFLPISQNNFCDYVQNGRLPQKQKTAVLGVSRYVGVVGNGLRWRRDSKVGCRLHLKAIHCSACFRNHTLIRTIFRVSHDFLSFCLIFVFGDLLIVFCAQKTVI